MDVDKLKAGPETDVLVAERVMGWHKFDDGDIPCWCFTRTKTTHPDRADDWLIKFPHEATGWTFADFNQENNPWGYQGIAWKGVWCPSQDIAAAWEARTKVVDSTGAVMELMDYGGPKDDFERYACTFLKERPNSGGLEWGASGWANTVTLAICRAVLKPVKD